MNNTYYSWEVRLFYDNRYYVTIVTASSSDEAEVKIKKKINTSKEYKILSVKRVDGVIKRVKEEEAYENN